MSKTSKERFNEAIATQDKAHKQLTAKFLEHATIARNVFHKFGVKRPNNLAWIYVQQTRNIHSISIQEGLIKFKIGDQSYFIAEQLLFSDMGTIAKHYRNQAKELRALAIYERTSAKELADFKRAQDEERQKLQAKINAHTNWLTNRADGQAAATRRQLQDNAWKIAGTGTYQYSWR